MASGSFIKSAAAIWGLWYLVRFSGKESILVIMVFSLRWASGVLNWMAFVGQ